jgi:hypothetical protein
MEESKLDNLDAFGCIGEIDVFYKERGIDFVKELSSEFISAREQKKRIEYFSENIIIFTSKYDADLGEDLLIIEVVYRKLKENNVEFYYIPNRTLYSSYLLYLINKGESK